MDNQPEGLPNELLGFFLLIVLHGKLFPDFWCQTRVTNPVYHNRSMNSSDH